MPHNNLPEIRGDYFFDFDLKNFSAVKTSGVCEILFTPEDQDDLENFLLNKDQNLDITIIGNLSNILIRNGGIKGCVVSLKKFNQINFNQDSAIVGAGTLLTTFIKKSISNGFSCCEKLFCIPGSIAGAVFMNAGIPEFEICEVLSSLTCIDKFSAELEVINRSDLKMSYRDGGLPKNKIITSVILNLRPSDKEILELQIKEIQRKRIASQPISALTFGSTFKNPKGLKAWQLIKEAGCEGLQVNKAAVSEKHCNFLVNLGSANCSDFLELIEIIKAKVFNKTGILLVEEVKILGEDK